MQLVYHITVTHIQYCQKWSRIGKKNWGKIGVIYGQWSRAEKGKNWSRIRKGLTSSDLYNMSAYTLYWPALMTLSPGSTKTIKRLNFISSGKGNSAMKRSSTLFNKDNAVFLGEG